MPSSGQMYNTQTSVSVPVQLHLGLLLLLLLLLQLHLRVGQELGHAVPVLAVLGPAVRLEVGRLGEGGRADVALVGLEPVVHAPDVDLEAALRLERHAAHLARKHPRPVGVDELHVVLEGVVAAVALAALDALHGALVGLHVGGHLVRREDDVAAHGAHLHVGDALVPVVLLDVVVEATAERKRPGAVVAAPHAVHEDAVEEGVLVVEQLDVAEEAAQVVKLLLVARHDLAHVHPGQPEEEEDDSIYLFF